MTLVTAEKVAKVKAELAHPDNDKPIKDLCFKHGISVASYYYKPAGQKKKRKKKPALVAGLPVLPTTFTLPAKSESALRVPEGYAVVFMLPTRQLAQLLGGGHAT